MRSEQVRMLAEIPLMKRMRAVKHLIDNDESLTPEDRERLFILALWPNALFVERPDVTIVLYEDEAEEQAA